MTMIKKYLLPILVVAFLSNVIYFENATFALQIEQAAPNELTAEKSHEINEQKKVINILLVTISVAVLVAIIISITQSSKNSAKSKTKRVRKN